MQTITNTSQQKINHLLQPSQEEVTHSQKLVDLIHARIKNNCGKISFADYMELALYAPGLGYYSGGKTKLGPCGDFVTAPEISPLFSYCLAQQCMQVLQQFDDGSILEFGAGSGIMAANLLLELERLHHLPKQYYILEVSAHLKQLQQETISQHCPHLLKKVCWLDALPDDAIQGVILANEVLDAMPVHLFEIQNQQIFEKYVGFNDDKFEWVLGDVSNEHLLQHIKQLQSQLNLDNYLSEVNLSIAPWLNSLDSCLSEGVVLLIDYGFFQAEYYHPQRNSGTLMCHYRHHAHPEPLILTGLQDITAHVDFSHVANAAGNAGFNASGYCNQATFLLSCGLLNYLEDIDDPTQQYELAQQVKKLTMPTEMGELFKVMALSKRLSIPLLGFSMQNNSLG